MTTDKFPICAAAECAACEDGHCIALVKTFKKRKCPFFKTREQNEKEKADCEQRLAEIRMGNKEDNLC